MKTVVFQGDSITDAGRFTEGTIDIGYGYPAMVAADIGARFPLEYKFINRAVSGNRIVDMYARIKRDIINLKPDYLSIMIGVNDVWHNIGDDPNGVDTDKFKKIYDMLLSEISEMLPKTKLILLTPYYTERSASFSEDFKQQVIEKADVTREMAKKYGARLIDTQTIIDAALEHAPLEHWTADGVHPTIFGHRIIADEYEKVLMELRENEK